MNCFFWLNISVGCFFVKLKKLKIKPRAIVFSYFCWSEIFKKQKGLISTHTDENKGYCMFYWDVAKCRYTSNCTNCMHPLSLRVEFRGRVEIGGVYKSSQRTSNFVRDGRYSERGWECTPHPHQPGQIFPS